MRRAHAPRGLVAVDAGHVHIQQHEARGLGGEKLQRLLAALHGDRLQLHGAHGRGEAGANRRRVVNDQDFGGHVLASVPEERLELS